MQNIKVITFNVGQGLFNLVTGIRDDGSPYCGIFDCGNFVEYKDLNCIEKALEILKDYTIIDDVVISHQDQDHWRNFLSLMIALNDEKATAEKWYKANDESLCHFVSHKSFESLSFREDTAGYLFYHIEKDHLIRAEHTVSGASDDSMFMLRIRNEMDLLILSIEINKELQQNSSQYRIKVYNHIPLCPCNIVANSSEELMLNNILALVESTLSSVDYDVDKKNEIFGLIAKAISAFCYTYVEYRDFSEQLIIENITKVIRNLFLGGKHCGFSYKLFVIEIQAFTQASAWRSPSIFFCYSYVDVKVDKESRYKHMLTYDENIIGPSGRTEFQNNDIKKNVTSQITSLKIAKKSFILFPGDVTVHAFLSLANEPKTGYYLYLFIAPHHGSCHTNFAYEINANREVVFSANQPLDKLLEKFPPQRIHISADRERFGHPSESFVDLCEKYCSGTVTEHKVVYCPDSTKDRVAPKTTQKAIYTTENLKDLIFSFPPPSMIDKAKPPSKPTQIPGNDLFISYGGFNL